LRTAGEDEQQMLGAGRAQSLYSAVRRWELDEVRCKHSLFSSKEQR
jgi:hypothetical protein